MEGDGLGVLGQREDGGGAVLQRAEAEVVDAQAGALEVCGPEGGGEVGGLGGDGGEQGEEDEGKAGWEVHFGRG